MKQLIHIFAALLVSSLMAEPNSEVRTSAHATTMAVDGTELWTYHHDPVEGKPYFPSPEDDERNAAQRTTPKGSPLASRPMVRMEVYQRGELLGGKNTAAMPVSRSGSTNRSPAEHS